MDNRTVSVIVPVYNIESYLRQCIDSIINQTYIYLEIILVDDGSIDKSGVICDEYQKKDSRIHVIHKKNGGLVSAWMAGLEASTSNYIAFVDGDDWISLDWMKVMLEHVQHFSADMAVGNIINVTPRDTYKNKDAFRIGFYDEEALKDEIYPNMLNAGGFENRGIAPNRCGKIIRKELLLKNLHYSNKEISYAEDLNIIFPVLLDVQSLVLVDDQKANYYYRHRRPDSIMCSYKPNMYCDVKYVYNTLFQACIDKKQNFESQLLTDYLAAIVQCYKNELKNPLGFNAAKENIKILCQDKRYKKAVEKVAWKNYEKLNVIIIKVMSNYKFFGQNIVTYFLFILMRIRNCFL